MQAEVKARDEELSAIRKEIDELKAAPSAAHGAAAASAGACDVKQPPARPAPAAEDGEISERP